MFRVARAQPERPVIGRWPYLISPAQADVIHVHLNFGPSRLSSAAIRKLSADDSKVFQLPRLPQSYSYIIIQSTRYHLVPTFRV